MCLMCVLSEPPLWVIWVFGGFIVPLSFRGTLNGEVFEYYVSQVLAPVMCEGDVLVFDNLLVHKVANVLDPLIVKGVKIVFLSVYLSVFNPMELVWSKIKAYLRKVKPRLLDDLYKVIFEALTTITIADVEGWIKHYGYGL